MEFAHNPIVTDSVATATTTATKVTVRSASENVVRDANYRTSYNDYRKCYSIPITIKEKNDLEKNTAALPNKNNIPSLNDIYTKLKKYSYSSSTTMSYQPVQLAYCIICMSNNSKCDMFSFSRCDQHHEFCKVCVQKYTTTLINEGTIIHACPLIGSCSGYAEDDEIRELVDDITYEKYSRYKINRLEPNMRECHECKKMILGNNSKPLMHCECGAVFCFFHGSAHPDITCEQYIKQTRSRDRATRRLLRTVTRKCPTCQADTEKNGGCNHMTCQYCKTDWCWICSRIADENHYDLRNLSGCPGAQFIDSSRFDCCRNSIFPMYCLTYMNIAPQLLFLSFWFAFTLLFGVIALLGAISVTILLSPITLIIASIYKHFNYILYPGFTLFCGVLAFSVIIAQIVYFPLSIFSGILLLPIYLPAFIRNRFQLTSEEFIAIRLFLFYPTMITMGALDELARPTLNEN